jgi:toxin ParE1/3/4
MAQRVIWTQSAANDLEQTGEYIAKDSPYYASSFIQKIMDISRSLSRFPHRGRMTPEFGDPEIREILIGNYRLIYQVGVTEISILGLVHGARNLRDFWKNRPF